MQVVKIVKSNEESSTMSATKAVFVLVHGGWHNHSVWDRVTPLLEANGFAALTLDLPGAGVNAIAPTSLGLRPFDPAAFAVEQSPSAGVTQEERTQAVVALVKEAASRSNGKVILVGHSAGGMTISAVAEQVPNLLLAVVYLAGFMGCSWAIPSPSARHGSIPDQPTKPTDRYSKLLFMATCRTPSSRTRRRNCITTNRTPAP
jgi:alpha-beta hydrolase superfamily lysophospholipase